MADIHVAQRPQIIHKRGIPGTGLVVAKQLRLVAAGGQRAELGKRGVPDGCAGHGKHGQVQRVGG